MCVLTRTNIYVFSLKSESQDPHAFQLQIPFVPCLELQVKREGGTANWFSQMVKPWESRVQARMRCVSLASLTVSIFSFLYMSIRLHLYVASTTFPPKRNSAFPFCSSLPFPPSYPYQLMGAPSFQDPMSIPGSC